MESFDRTALTTQNEKLWLFYSSYSCFSNFYICHFSVDGIVFSSSEQYFHYIKAILFNDHVSAGKILNTDACFEQKRLGRLVNGFDETVWVLEREGIMKKALKSKFGSNEILKARLLATDGYELVEASPFDTIWGIGLSMNDTRIFDKSQWRGLNLLGKILNELREEFKQEAH